MEPQAEKVNGHAGKPNGSAAEEPQKHAVLHVFHFAKVPRNVVLNRIETADSIEDRVFWAIVLWSWCGPQASDAMVVKDRRGYIQKDSGGNPIPAKAVDVLTILGLAPSMQGSVARAIKRLVEKGSIRYEDRVLYPVRDPSMPPERIQPEEPEIIFVGRRAINLAKIPFPDDIDEEDRTEIIEWIREIGTGWRAGLQNLRTTSENMLVQGLRDRGIIIDFREKKRRQEDPSVQPSVLPSYLQSEERMDGRTDLEELEQPEERMDGWTAPPEPRRNPDSGNKPIQEMSQLEEIRLLVTEELGARFTDTPTEWLCRKIAENLEDAPLELLRSTIRSKIRKIQGLGLLPSLAANAAKTYRELEAARPAPPPRRPPVPDLLPLDTIEHLEGEYRACRERAIQDHIDRMGPDSYAALHKRITREVKAAHPLMTEEQLRETIIVTIGNEIAAELNLSLERYIREHAGG